MKKAICSFHASRVTQSSGKGHRETQDVKRRKVDKSRKEKEKK